MIQFVLFGRDVMTLLDSYNKIKSKFVEHFGEEKVISVSETSFTVTLKHEECSYVVSMNNEYILLHRVENLYNFTNASVMCDDVMIEDNSVSAAYKGEIICVLWR